VDVLIVVALTQVVRELEVGLLFQLHEGLVEGVLKREALGELSGGVFVIVGE